MVEEYIKIDMGIGYTSILDEEPIPYFYFWSLYPSLITQYSPVSVFKS